MRFKKPTITDLFQSAVKVLLPLAVIISAYLTTTKLPIFPAILGTAFTVLKEATLIGIVGIGFIMYLKDPGRISIPQRYIVWLGLYIVVLLVYTIVSPLGIIAPVALLPIISAPLVFVVLSQTYISQDTAQKVLKYIYSFLLINVLIGLPLHVYFYEYFKSFFMINAYLENSGVQTSNIYRFTSSGAMVPRLLGIVVSPTDMATMSIFIILFTPTIIKKRILQILLVTLSVIVLYLTRTRCTLIGLAIGLGILFFSRRKMLNKAILSGPIIGATILIVVAGYLFWPSVYDSLDGSAKIHLNDIAKDGIDLVGNYWYGLGIGVAGFFSKRFDLAPLGIDKIHLESDHFAMMINISVIGYFVFVIASILPLFSIEKISKKMNSNWGVATAAILFFLSIFIGGIFFPLIFSSRLPSYLQWIALLCAFKIHQTPEQVPDPIKYGLTER